MPTSILIELLLSGGMRKECTHRSFSFTTSAILREIDTRMKYLQWSLGKIRSAGDTDKSIPQLDIDALVTFELLLDVLELKVECLRGAHLAWSSQLL